MAKKTWAEPALEPKTSSLIVESGRENYDSLDRDSNQDLRITASALSDLSYPTLWNLAVPNSQLHVIFAKVVVPVRSI